MAKRSTTIANSKTEEPLEQEGEEERERGGKGEEGRRTESKTKQ